MQEEIDENRENETPSPTDAWDDSEDAEGAPEETPQSADTFAPIPPREKAIQTDEDRKLRSQSYKILAQFGNFGIFLLLAVLFGYFIGKWSDQLFGTKPVFTIMWMLFGVAAAIRELYRNVKKAMDPDKVMNPDKAMEPDKAMNPDKAMEPDKAMGEKKE